MIYFLVKQLLLPPNIRRRLNMTNKFLLAYLKPPPPGFQVYVRNLHVWQIIFSSSSTPRIRSTCKSLLRFLSQSRNHAHIERVPHIVDEKMCATICSEKSTNADLMYTDYAADNFFKESILRLCGEAR